MPRAKRRWSSSWIEARLAPRGHWSSPHGAAVGLRYQQNPSKAYQPSSQGDATRAQERET